MAVPSHLADIARNAVSNDRNGAEWCEFGIKCGCGCENFDIYENYLTKEEEALCKPYYDALDKLTRSIYGSGATKDEDGTIHHWVYKTRKGAFGEKEEVIIPPQPAMALVTVMKAKCPQCGNEYILFDSRKHGWYSMCDTVSAEEKDYSPHFRKKNRTEPRRIIIGAEYSSDTAEFYDTFPNGDYSNSFTWFRIFSVAPNGKKRLIFDNETD